MTMLVAMVTPFHTDGSLDAEGAQTLATYLIENQACDGLVLNGTTGEAPTTSDEEKETLIRAVAEAVGGRATIIAGAGSFDTRHAVELARTAEKAGAEGLLVVTPYYSRPTQEGIRYHITTIVSAITTKAPGTVAVKALLNDRGLPAGPVRLPLVPADTDLLNHLRQACE
ncbi:hypothetical protein GCM10009555_083670 [Acrocarpospora macrocephala]|uniref:4-hydroxy-tetrahydrodipicolinate synthase n=1 Tax=Acrocarpospora macrocephala TaxID=150177 RepID=A0A5M3WYU1_9ACTN|nr:hypothetical protein Amac_070790 [Acrocarpospora macrocephala]